MVKETKPSGPGRSVLQQVQALAAAPDVLVLAEEGQPERELALRRGSSYLVGREPRCELLVVEDEEVSRLHATLRWAPERGWLYRDLGSSNGSRKDGQPLDGEVVLRVGDVITVGPRTTLHAAAQRGTAETQTPVAFASSAQRQLVEGCEKAARRTVPVLLLGPSGAGKTMCAREIHELSRQHPERSGVTGAFVPINCGRLPDDAVWLSSFFLGHAAGAFTGAKETEGVLPTVREGTLFLDEVESMPPAAQVFLLDVLDGQGNAARLGAGGRAQVEVPLFRLIAATKTPLGRTPLRGDLVNRLLDGMQLEVPSLRQRKEDLPAFVSTFTRNFSVVRGCPVEFSAEAMEELARYEWPGEVRELRSAVHLLLMEALDRAPAGGRLRVEGDDVAAVLAARQGARGQAAVDGGRPKAARQLTKDDVVSALAENGGNLERTARALGVARNTLKAKMSQFGIER